jgi:NADPH:quinone reductase-like Zn-dependent oxidoreductase
VKAVLLRGFGPPGVLRLEEVPTPEPGPGEVLIEVHAVSVNRTLDLVVRAGRYAKPVQLPHVLGADPSGVIAAVGPGVAADRIGERVFTSLWVEKPTASAGPRLLGVHAWGGYAEYVKVPAAIAHPLPDGIDFPTATIVTRHAPLAFGLLRGAAKLTPGEWVLVMGAAGGLGSAGVQAAKYLGAHVVAAAGADARVAAAVELGADAGVNYRAQDLTAEVMRLTEGRGVDVVFEYVGDPDLFPKAFETLARGGRLVRAGAHAGGIVPLDVNRLYLNRLTVLGSTAFEPEDVATSLEAAVGRFAVMIDRILPLAAAAEAHEIVEARQSIGKVLLDPRR